MNSDERIVAILGTGTIILLFIGFTLDMVSFTDILIGVIFALVLSSGYILYQRKWLQNTLSNFQANGSSNGYKNDLTDQEAREKVKEWAERNYPASSDVQFYWNNAEDATVRVPSTLDGVDMEKLYAIWTDTGVYNQPIQIFYNCTTDEKLSHRKIKYEEQRSQPFQFCEYYKEARRNARMASRSFNDNSRNGGQITLTGQGLGLDTSSLTPVNQEQADGEEN